MASMVCYKALKAIYLIIFAHPTFALLDAPKA